MIKNIRKTLIILVSFVGTILLVCYLININQNELDPNYFSKVIRILEREPSEQELIERKNDIEQRIKNGEDIVENVEIEDGFVPLAIKDKVNEYKYYLGYKNDLTPSVIIEAIGQVLGWNIKVLFINETNNRIKIKIDKDSLKEIVILENNKEITLDNEIEKIVKDSINDILKEIYDKKIIIEFK